MAASELSRQLEFLTKAAHLLKSTSPETSAFLMSSRNKLMVENDIALSDQQKHHVCTCCGQIMIPGQRSSIQIDRPKTSGRGKASSGHKFPARQGQQVAKQHGPSKVLQCYNCGRYTRFTIPKPVPITRKNQAASNTPASLSRGRPAEAQKPSSNASSKKRAKNRKAGLQALLDQNKSSGGQAVSGLGLSLSDFMKR